MLGVAFITFATINPALCTIFEDIKTVAGNTQNELVSLAETLLPLIIIIDILAIIFTRDQKKLQMEIGILVSAIIGYLALLIVANGTLSTTLKNLTN